ncbi:hypothetical protein [Luteolibacter sp. LG18]|uniref:hypothetical protein n=1 Tax=Luteolibacter sp. LG18 TaxID=2819286 RepID=UPI002B2D282E|nr:hypothetical protein llg_32460 [Luteolibacter sp. LG18]
MFPLNRLLPFIGFGIALAYQADGATTLVNASTLNGSFENGSGNNTITSWAASTTGGSMQRQNNYASNGGWSLLVAVDASNKSVDAALNTGYQLVSGDTFALSFDSRGAFNADNTDQVTWTLFYTSDNTLSGTRTTLYSGSQTLTGATGDANTSPYNASGTLTTGAVDPSAAGKTLFLSFTPGSGIITNEFARVDNVVLSVTSVPEPAAFAALAATIPFLVVRRTRRSA